MLSATNNCDASLIQVKLDHDDDEGDTEFEISDEEEEEEVSCAVFNGSSKGRLLAMGLVLVNPPFSTEIYLLEVKPYYFPSTKWPGMP